jgi:hypothetical protein
MKKTNNNGFVLAGSLMLLLIGMLVAGSFIFVSRQSHAAVIRWARYDQALLAAQSAMEKVKADLYDEFKAEHMQSRRWSDLDWVVAHAASFGTSGTLGNIVGSEAPCAYTNAAITATVASSQVIGSSPEERVVFVTNTVSAAVDGITRTIEEVVRYTLNRSSVFDHAYFINNFGWFYDVDCIVNGDVRSNYDVELRSRNLILNGHSYAAGINDVNKPYQTWSWTTYKNDANSEFFRPTYHVDQDTKNDASIFEFGYDDSDTHNKQTQLEMPYIGNLLDYKYYAEVNNGTVQTGGAVAVNNVYSGTGPSGYADAADQGSIVLAGTAADPIVINGPVVIEGDVVIKGYYTGQGTIYAGRNIHIIGDLIAIDAPQWKQPDTAVNFSSNTLPDNLEADFLGLCAKGSIVIGDYRASGFVTSITPYLKPPFTSAYEVTAADSDIGYVSYTSGGTNYFNGDYTATYGTKCGTVATNGVARKYYESSLSDTQFGSYNPQVYVGRIDAFVYNNHLTTGRFSSGAMINGGIICRDEALLPSGRVYMNWDSRVALDDDFKPFLPMELGPAETIQWRELIP